MRFERSTKISPTTGRTQRCSILQLVRHRFGSSLSLRVARGSRERYPNDTGALADIGLCYQVTTQTVVADYSAEPCRAQEAKLMWSVRRLSAGLLIFAV